jgi:hypothetical protein
MQTQKSQKAPLQPLAEDFERVLALENVVLSLGANSTPPLEIARGSRARLLRLLKKLREGRSKESQLALVQCALEIVTRFESTSGGGGTTIGVSRQRSFLDRANVEQCCVVKTSTALAPEAALFEADFDAEPATRIFRPQALVDAECYLLGNWLLECGLSPFYPSVYCVATSAPRAADVVLPREVAARMSPLDHALHARRLSAASTVSVVMQQLDGSLEELLKSDFFLKPKTGSAGAGAGASKIEWRRVAAMLCQVMFGLAQGYAISRLVHNDFHAANVMYEETPVENFVYYRFRESGPAREPARGPRVHHTLAVPTFGKMYKQIDFGRASFTWPRDTSDAAPQHMHPVPTPARPLRVSDFWHKAFTKRNRLDANRPATDLIRIAFEIEYLLTASMGGSGGGASAANFDVNDASAMLVHRLLTEFTRTRGGGTIRSKLHELGLEEDSDTEIKCFVWLPMLHASVSPCVCTEPRDYLHLFVAVFGVADSEIPSDAHVYDLVD